MEKTTNKIEDRATDTKPSWNAPTITLIDIKRTMFSSGTGSDGVFVSP